MSLARVKIENFQSIHSADVELGRFTVIVGASSSGKSAFMRALGVLSRNSRGAPYVTHGKKMSVVSATLESGAVVTIERGGSHGAYKIAAPQTEPVEFTKLAGGVPEQVEKLLRIDSSKDSVNFAGQFDRPFLLDASGSEVARVIGELTNVHVIYNAVREANRRHSAAKSLANTRRTDLAALVEQAQQYKDLPARLAAVEKAEAAVARARQISEKRSRALNHVQQLSVSQTALKSAEARLVTVPQLDLSRAEAAVNRKARFEQLIHELRSAVTSMREAQARVEAATRSEQQHAENYHAKLVELGTCPVCGQDTKEVPA